MPLETIIPTAKLLNFTPKEFKSYARSCASCRLRVSRTLKNKRRDLEELEAKKSLKPKERKQHQKLCAQVNELGDEEVGYEVQIKEIAQAIKTWFR